MPLNERSVGSESFATSAESTRLCAKSKLSHAERVCAEAADAAVTSVAIATRNLFMTLIYASARRRAIIGVGTTLEEIDRRKPRCGNQPWQVVRERRAASRQRYADDSQNARY